MPFIVRLLLTALPRFGSLYQASIRHLNVLPSRLFSFQVFVTLNLFELLPNSPNPDSGIFSLSSIYISLYPTLFYLQACYY